MMRNKWLLGAGVGFAGLVLFAVLFGDTDPAPRSGGMPGNRGIGQFDDDFSWNAGTYRNGYGGRPDGNSFWDRGVTRGFSRQGDNRMYTNWHTDTAVSSNDDAGYISLGDGTFCSWD